MARPEPAPVPLEPAHEALLPPARREGRLGQLVPSAALALADFARHLSLSARRRTADAYLDVLQRLLGFGLDPLECERSELERFLARNRRGRWGDSEGSLATTTQTAELAALRRFYRWARAEGLRGDDPTEGIRPPRREPYARARGLSVEEVARLLAVIPGDSAAGLRLRALVLAYLLTGSPRRTSAIDASTAWAWFAALAPADAELAVDQIEVGEVDGHCLGATKAAAVGQGQEGGVAPAASGRVLVVV